MAPEREPARPGGVCGVAVGLVVLALCVLAFFAPRGGPADGAALLAEWFGPGATPDELPFELAVVRAARLPGGAQVVALAAPDAFPLEPAAEARLAGDPSAADASVEGAAGEDPGADRGAAATAESDPAPPPPPKIDWAAIEPVADGTPPERVVVIRYPLAQAEDVFEAQFQKLAWRRIDEIEPGGGRTAVDSGEIAWGELSARYVVERRFTPKSEPTFADLLRVSLASRERFCVLYALWPPRELASPARVEELLRALPPPRAD